MYPSRRPKGGPPASREARPVPAAPPRSSAARALDRAARRTDRARDRPMLAPSGEAEIVRELRRRFVTWACVCGPLFGIDVATGHHAPRWSLFVAAMWGGT